MGGSLARDHIPARPDWRMPLSPERYDRGPLSEAERDALAVLFDREMPVTGAARKAAEAALARLSRPLHEVYALRRRDAGRRAPATRLMLRQMHRRRRAFWQWAPREWHEVVGATARDFDEANALSDGRDGLRPHLLDVAYLLCD